MRAVTSASNLFRRALCPGSARLEAGLPDEETEYTREGTLLHDYSIHPEYDRAFLRPVQRDLLELAESLRATVIERVGLHSSPDKHLIEQYLVLGSLNGSPDEVVYHFKDHAGLVVDKKFGYGEVERAELNLQLRAYAVLADSYSPVMLGEFYVAIIQPRAPYDERITIARYNRDDIAASLKEIEAIIELTTHDRARLNPGEQQCRNCKARLICPALQQSIELSLAPFIPRDQLTKTARESFVEDRLAQCTDDQLSSILQAISFTGFISDSAKAEARKRIEAGKLEGYTLGKGSKVRDITDPRRAIALLTLARVLTREQLLDIADLKVRQIENAYREVSGVSGRQAREKVEKVLASVMEISTRKPSILKK
jgi:Protein of unknown function (DUF2800)